ncbi:MAG TPA: hypothetical protein VJ521_13685, partial [Acidobacteriota bacterium]|nr:hypothetical protein [Acidobacteriota bacterium]
MRNLAVVFCILSLLSAAAGSPFADSPAGKRAQAYFDAFNSGEEAMSKFFTENISEESLQKRTVSQRLEVYRQMRNDVGSLTVRKIVEPGPNSLEVSAQGDSNRWLTIRFDFQPVEPHKILGMQ